MCNTAGKVSSICVALVNPTLNFHKIMVQDKGATCKWPSAGKVAKFKSAVFVIEVSKEWL